MNSLPADAALLAVACPRCHAAIAVPYSLFGQPAACPICTGGFLAPQPVAQQPVAQPAEMSQAVMSQAVMPSAAAPAGQPQFQRFDTAEPPPQAIRRGAESIELRRLTPEEKATRRVRRNIITIGAGTAVLFAIVLLATRGSGKKSKRKPR